MRYKDCYEKWKEDCNNQTDLVKKFEHEYFNQDFRAGNSHKDFIWPVLLFTIFIAIGWFFSFQRVLPSFAPMVNLISIPDGFVFGFIGAYLASVLTIFDGFRRYDLDPGLYYSVTFRVMFSSFVAYVASLMLNASFQPIVALGVGLFPLETTWAFITQRAAGALGAGQTEKEAGMELSNIQGLEHSDNRRKLLDIGISTVQGLATADPLLLFFRTTFPLRTVVDMVDKAILYLYLQEDVIKLRKHGINGVIELVALAKLAEKIPAYKSQQEAETIEPLGELFITIDHEELIKDIAKVIGQTPAELKTFIYNMYYDPMVKLIYEIWGGT